MKNIAMIVAALALVAGGCAKKQATRVETAETRAEQQEAEKTDEEVAKTDDELDQFAKDVEEDADRNLKDIEDATARARDEGEDVVKEVDVTSGEAPDTVTAEVMKLDREARKITFRIKDTKEEIELQAGKTIEVAFDDLERLTGKTTDEAVEALREGTDYEVVVDGVGDAMKIAKIEFAEVEKKIRHEKEELDKKY